MQDPSSYFLQQYQIEVRKKHLHRRFVQCILVLSIALAVFTAVFLDVPAILFVLVEGTLLLSAVIFTISSRRKALERQETLFMMLELDPELLDHPHRMEVALHAVEAGELQSIQVSKTQRRNRGSDEKGFTSGRADSQMDVAQARRDATQSNSEYEGLEDDLRPSERLVSEANTLYQERADELWKDSESKDTDLIEAGVEKLGDLVRTDWFEKNAKSGAVQELMDSQKQDEGI